METGQAVKDAREFNEGELEAMLPGLWKLRRDRDDLGRAYNTGKKPIDDWLDQHPGEQLRDQETGTFASLQIRKGRPQLDLITLQRELPDVVDKLAELGLLVLDVKAFEAQEGKFAAWLDANRYVGTGPGSTALRIEKETS